jgi:hypothetical protein
MSPWNLLGATVPANSAVGRRASWLELFFDLIFVAAVAQVGRPLHADYSLAALALRLSLLSSFNSVGAPVFSCFTVRFRPGAMQYELERRARLRRRSRRTPRAGQGP